MKLVNNLKEGDLRVLMAKDNRIIRVMRYHGKFQMQDIIYIEDHYLEVTKTLVFR